MLSSVLRSDKAIDVNVFIIRAFVRLRGILATHKDVARKLEEHDRHIANLYAHVERLLTPPPEKKKPIGFIWSDEESSMSIKRPIISVTRLPRASKTGTVDVSCYADLSVGVVPILNFGVDTEEWVINGKMSPTGS